MTETNQLQWRRLASAAIWTNILPISILLMAASLLAACSMAIGLLIGLVCYGLLFRSLDRSIRFVRVGINSGSARQQASAYLIWVQSVKLIGVGLFLTLLFSTVHLNIPFLLAGFLLTQFSVSISALSGSRPGSKKLTKTYE